VRRDLGVALPSCADEAIALFDRILQIMFRVNGAAAIGFYCSRLNSIKPWMEDLYDDESNADNTTLPAK
jgi:hypothetical protein